MGLSVTADGRPARPQNGHYWSPLMTITIFFQKREKKNMDYKAVLGVYIVRDSEEE